MDFIYEDMNEKFEFTTTTTRNLDLTVAKIAGAVKRVVRVLPKNFKISPRSEVVAAITLSNGK